MSNMEIDRVLAQIRNVSQGGGVGGPGGLRGPSGIGAGQVLSITALPSC